MYVLDKAIASHSSVLASRIPGTGEPGGLPSMGSHRVGHDWSDLAEQMYVYMHSFLESWVVVSLVFSSVSCSVWTILPIYLTQSGSSQFLPNTCLHGITKEFHFIYYLFVLFLSCARSSLLCGPFSSCGQWGLLSSCIVWPLIAVASPVAEHGLV